MPVFQGTVRLDTDPDAALPSLLTLDGDRLSLAAGGSALGEWNLEDLKFSKVDDAIRIQVGDESVMFQTTYLERLTEAVGLNQAEETTRRTRGPKHGRQHRRQPRLRLEDVPLKFRLGVGAGAVLLAMFIVVPGLLVTLLALGGAAAVLVSLFGLMEPTVTARFPTELPPTRVLTFGLVLMVVALVVAAVT